MDTLTPHGFCLAWEPQLLWLTVLGHAGTALAYFGIPIMLLATLRKISTVPVWLRAMFAAFILLCGISHLFEIVTLWMPLYWAAAVVDNATAVISLLTLWFLPLGIERMRRLR